MKMIDALVDIAVDLTAAITAKDRYDRLLEALQTVLPYDAAALLRLEKDLLIPVAAEGLMPEAMGREYARSSHPRLNIICNSPDPVLFPSDETLPDPFDGLLTADNEALSHIHACLGCPLIVNQKLVGVLTADALDPKAFDHIEPQFLKALGALAGAQMQTAHLVEALERNAERQGQIVSDLMQDIDLRQGNQILGSSPVMAHLRREISLVARSDFTVLVLGETGVGKELVARAIHAASDRRDNTMLYLNCAALPETLAESELFGHVKGAFTGANKDRTGKFELADGGTLFLDEIGEMPPAIQAKLLRAIQEGEIQRLGSNAPIHVDVRLLAATNRNLEKEVETGRFRADLFHRLNVYPISVPPLKKRIADIPILAGYFCERIQRRLGLPPIRISPEAYDILSRYTWPGNVRELENVISRAVLKASGQSNSQAQLVLSPDHLGSDLESIVRPVPSSFSESPVRFSKGFSLSWETKAFQKRMIEKAVEANKGNWAAAARDLGLHRSNLHNLATRLGLRKKQRD